MGRGTMPGNPGGEEADDDGRLIDRLLQSFRIDLPPVETTPDEAETPAAEPGEDISLLVPSPLDRGDSPP